MDRNTSAKATFASAYAKPVNAVITGSGEPVKISHVGDVQGMSPSYLVVDKNGQSSWVSQSEVTIIDQDFLPTSAEALEGIQRSLSGSALSGRSR